MRKKWFHCKISFKSYDLFSSNALISSEELTPSTFVTFVPCKAIALLLKLVPSPLCCSIVITKCNNVKNHIIQKTKLKVNILLLETNRNV